MNNFFKFLFIVIFSANLISCGSKDAENDEEQSKEQETTIKKTIENEKDTSNNASYDSVKAIEQSILRKQRYKRKEEEKTLDSLEINETKPEINTETTVENTVNSPSSFILMKILNESKMGETLTQKELILNQNIPKDAIKLVKSITKVSEDELEVKWHSTWLVEKMSDAKFKDGKIKLRFKNNIMYTSGDAIGIKYKKKIYNDLVISGRKVRIPNVKGFYWEVGK